MKKNYKLTMFCCFGGCLVQAMVINYLPLLFVVFQDTFGMPLEQITLLVTINFIVQLTVDFLAAFFIDRIGYKVGVIAAHGFCSLGLVCLAFLPDVMTSPFADRFIRFSIALTAYMTPSGSSPLTLSTESRLTTETPISCSIIRMFSSKEPNTLMVSSRRSRLMLCSVMLSCLL